MGNIHMKKGQASIEFLLTLLIALIYISTIIQPAVDTSQSAMTDVANLSKLTISQEKITNAIEYVNLSGKGTRQTMQIVIPQGATLECDGTELIAKYPLQSNSTTTACKGTIDLDGDDSLCTKNTTPSGGCPTTINLDEDMYSIVIEKNATNGKIEAIVG